MRHFLLLGVLGCVKPVPVAVPYITVAAEPERLPTLRILERGSGVVDYAAAPARIQVTNPAVATVIRLDGDHRFHVFGESAGQTELTADFGQLRHSLQIEVVAESPAPEVLLKVGQQASVPVPEPVHRVRVGDPAILSFQVTSDERAVQVKGLRPGKSHIVVSVGEEATPVFAWVEVTP
jgi:Flp pilus assembly secretin CpaC